MSHAKIVKKKDCQYILMLNRDAQNGDSLKTGNTLGNAKKSEQMIQTCRFTHLWEIMDYKARPAGFEQPPETSEKPHIPSGDSANYGALPSNSVQNTPGLDGLLSQWDTLPQAVKETILALVQKTKTHSTNE